MGYQADTTLSALDVLGDPMRRRILEVLLGRPRPVAEIAAELPVSRPAVSRHLRLLKQAGLVSDTAQGTQRIYRIDRAGFAPVIAYWDQFWDEALSAFKTRVEARRDG
ncbi:MAG: ArsR/SmtB family transcription factor [Acidimicrobiia bacterium]